MSFYKSEHCRYEKSQPAKNIQNFNQVQHYSNWDIFQRNKMKQRVISILILISFFLSVARAIPVNQGETYLTNEVMTALQQLFNQKVSI